MLTAPPSTPSQCIGRRNYTPFIAFLVSATLCALYAIAFSAWHIAHEHKEAAAAGTRWATWDVVGSFVVAVVAFALVCPIAGLLGYHIRLLLVNRTTIEMVCRIDAAVDQTFVRCDIC